METCSTRRASQIYDLASGAGKEKQKTPGCLLVTSHGNHMHGGTGSRSSNRCTRSQSVHFQGSETTPKSHRSSSFPDPSVSVAYSLSPFQVLASYGRWNSTVNWLPIIVTTRCVHGFPPLLFPRWIVQFMLQTTLNDGNAKFLTQT